MNSQTQSAKTTVQTMTPFREELHRGEDMVAAWYKQGVKLPDIAKKLEVMHYVSPKDKRLPQIQSIKKMIERSELRAKQADKEDEKAAVEATREADAVEAKTKEKAITLTRGGKTDKEKLVEKLALIQKINDLNKPCELKQAAINALTKDLTSVSLPTEMFFELLGA